jgi:prepilin-type N-terminal cleavage/methylation domain-containing protein
MKNCAGFSLIEIIMTIAIMSIVVSISTISFNSWTSKSNIEKQTRELFTDLSEARTKAFTQKKVHGIVFQPTSYVMKSYSSETEYVDSTAAATKGIVVATKTLKFTLTKTDTTSDITNTPVIFDTSGFTNDWYTIIVNPTTAQAALNCVVTSSARANMGKMNGTNCDFK